MSNSQELPVIEDWTGFLARLLDITANFPRRVRYSLAVRIDNLALDIMEDLLAARYASGQEKRQILDRANLSLDKLRLLLRICHDKRFLATRPYESCARAMESCGRQIGGWRKGRASK